MSILIGIDAGGSHTEAVLSRRDGSDYVRWRGGPGAVRADAEDQATLRWTEAVQGVLHRAGLPLDAVTVVVGAAGTGRSEVRRRLEATMVNTLPPQSRVRVVTDGLIALEAAFPDDGPGIVVMAGSGSIAYGRSGRGEVRRVGGHGWRIGDEGSGYALGQAALHRVGRTLDGRDPDTSLGRTLQEALHLPSVEALVPWSLHATPQDVAGLAQAVCDAASVGNRVAEELVMEAGRALAALAAALQPHLADATAVALGGGLLRAGSPVRAVLIERLRELTPGLRVSDGVVDPPLGALRFAETT